MVYPQSQLFPGPFLSLVFDSPSPSCSLDNSYFLPDNSQCLLEDSTIPPEKPGLDVKKALFKGFSRLATTSFHNSLMVGDPHNEAYDDYRLKGSEEEIIFYEECVETPSPAMYTPSLAKGLSSLVLDSPSPSSTLEMSQDKGELTGSVPSHGLPVGVSTGPYVTPVLPTLATQLSLAPMASTQCHTPPRPIYSAIHKLLVERLILTGP